MCQTEIVAHNHHKTTKIFLKHYKNQWTTWTLNCSNMYALAIWHSSENCISAWKPCAPCPLMN